MTRSFYNTTGEDEGTSEHYADLAAKQEKIILTHVKKTPEIPFTSEDLMGLFSEKTPLTSVRRAVCNLKTKGELVVIGKKKGTLYNRKIFVYAYWGRGAIND